MNKLPNFVFIEFGMAQEKKKSPWTRNRDEKEKEEREVGNEDQGRSMKLVSYRDMVGVSKWMTLTVLSTADIMEAIGIASAEAKMKYMIN